jgi:hypothetical protein
MNIQLPLMLVGITATAGVGVGTIAANTGGLGVSELSSLLSITEAVAQDGTTDPAVPGAPTPTTTSDPLTETVVVTDGGVTGTTTSPTSTNPIAVTPVTSVPPTNGTSGGSATGNYEDEDEDEDEDEYEYEEEGDDD